MPTWSGILTELMQSAGPPALDAVRRRYLVELQQHTGRETILYASKFTQPDSAAPPGVVSINDEDLQGMMEVTHGLNGTELDLILHSPGGSLEATEAIVIYLRSKFSNIRVIVPQLAMSAATMIACAADIIVMGKHSFLGPIDPQFILQTPLGQRSVPAQAILEQFDLAKEECRDPSKLAAWLPMLSQFGPDLLIQGKNSSDLSKALVEGWLKRFMFRQKDPQEASSLSSDISNWLSSHNNFHSHSRHIPRDECEGKGLSIESLENDQAFQDLVLSVFHATTFLFVMSPVVKIIENHLGKAFMKQAQPVFQAPLRPGILPPGVVFPGPQP
jgi:hypothetical protein